MRKAPGFTLIEVLIALAILSIALTAVIKSTAQSIKNTLYLQNKSIAIWLAEDILNQVQLGLIKPTSEKSTGQSNALSQKWRWNVELSATENNHIKKIRVTVRELASSQNLAELIGYEYV